MIKIGKIHSHLGEGVYSMRHDSCENDDQTEFLVNTRDSCPINFNLADGMVDCPWCHVKVALDIILNNDKRERALTGANNTREEQR